MFYADLHIHSRYSRATSRDCDLPHLDLWARKKGIALVGTGDFTHPAWRQELQEQLLPAEEGLYRLKEAYRLPWDSAWPQGEPRFLVTGEISSIYKQGGKTRKVHNVLLLPSLEAAEKLARRLERIGNLQADGRPILGLSSHDLLELTLESCPQAVFLPAHIWTPHFSLFGAFSGFDTLEECFGDLTPHIHAVETGLSSDPPMNWRVSQLDGLQLVSHSDAHSPQKLGREADILDTELSYPALKHALDTGEGLVGTVEFFPEEGKYHLDGHRSCGVRLSPGESAALGDRCPVCGKRLTIGVEHRVEELADRLPGMPCPHSKPFESLVPLPEVIANATGRSEASKRTQALYEELLSALGPEFAILREVPIEAIGSAAGPAVGEAVRRLRAGEVVREAGYDGVYGKVRLLTAEEVEAFNGQVSLFGPVAVPRAPRAKKRPVEKAAPPREEEAPPVPQAGLDDSQRQAVETQARRVAVVAGPGAGKTRTLTARVAHLLDSGVKPEEITVVTFTRRAAQELKERLEDLVGKGAAQGMAVGTFHALCRELLGRPPLLSQGEALALAEGLLKERDSRLSPKKLLGWVSQVKNGVVSPEGPEEEALFAAYEQGLKDLGVTDFDGLLNRALAVKELPPKARRPFSHLLVDEFQDVNALQYELVLQWSREGSLFVIGDPDQSIYGFRGAVGDCFQRLGEDFPDLVTLRLARNYRSSPQVLGCALPVISQNPGGPRRLEAMGKPGLPVRWVHAPDELSQGVFLAKEIGRMAGGLGMVEAQGDRENLRSFSEMAVLCRTHRQAEMVERCLRHDSIPCVVWGREDFLQDKKIRGLLGFLGTCWDFRDTASLKACLTLLWSCSPETVERARAACSRAESVEALSTLLEGEAALRPWLERLERYCAPAQREKPLSLLKLWEQEEGGGEPLEKLKNMAVFYSSLGDFLQDLSQGEEGDLRRAGGKGYRSGAVQVMTLHAAKGLEFPVVFLAGASRGVIPLESPGRENDPQEERRLFYVGMTRAKEELVLLSWGEASPFLGDIPSQQLQQETVPLKERPAEQLSLF